MNIIDTIRWAKEGKVIANNYWKVPHKCLKYMGNGIFCEYEIEAERLVRKREIDSFRLEDILSSGWEVVDINIKELSPKIS